MLLKTVTGNLWQELTQNDHQIRIKIIRWPPLAARGE